MSMTNNTLIFMGVEFVHPASMSDLEKEYSDLTDQRKEIESNPDWPDKEISFADILNPYAMIHKKCNN